MPQTHLGHGTQSLAEIEKRSPAIRKLRSRSYLLLRAPDRLSFCIRRSDILDSLRCMNMRSLSSKALSALFSAGAPAGAGGAASDAGLVRAGLGAFCGFLVYYNTVGRLFIAVCETVAAWVKRGLRCLAKLLWMPVRFLGRHLRAFAGKIAKPIVSRVSAWYNKKKEAKIEKKQKRRAKRRMERCGDVCRNGTEG